MKLTDESKMPFGKHKGKSMEDVPASYLMWLRDQFDDQTKSGIPLKAQQQAIRDYIADNEDVLVKELQ